jgi:hypothetical protein
VEPKGFAHNIDCYQERPWLIEPHERRYVASHTNAW